MTIDEIKRMTRAQLEEYILKALANMPLEKAVEIVTATMQAERKENNNAASQ